MELNIESQKQQFLIICRASIQREGLEDLPEDGLIMNRMLWPADSG